MFDIPLKQLLPWKQNNVATNVTMIISCFQIGTQTKKNTEKSYKKKLDMLEQIIRNLNYLLYESKKFPWYVWCIHLTSMWDKCYILESYIVMSNIILKTSAVIIYLCRLGLTKCCLLSFHQIILSVSPSAAKKRKQRLWMSLESKEVQRKERKINVRLKVPKKLLSKN